MTKQQNKRPIPSIVVTNNTTIHLLLQNSMAEPNDDGFLARIHRPNLPTLVAALGIAAALTLFDVLAVVFGLFCFSFGFAGLQILNLAAFLVNIILLHLTIAFSGGRPPEPRLAAGGAAAAGFLVWRTYALAKRAVFLTGVIAVLLEAAPPHLESIR